MLIIISNDVVIISRVQTIPQSFLGGCDGCVNIDNDSNNGLADLIADLEDIYQDNELESVLSR